MVVPTVITGLQALKQCLGFRHIYEVWSRNGYWRYQAQTRGGDDRDLGIIQKRDQPRQHAFLKQALIVVLTNSELNKVDDTWDVYSSIGCIASKFKVKRKVPLTLPVASSVIAFNLTRELLLISVPYYRRSEQPVLYSTVNGRTNDYAALVESYKMENTKKHTCSKKC